MANDNQGLGKPFDGAPTCLALEQLDELSAPDPQAPGFAGVRMLSVCHQAPVFAVYVYKSGKLGLQCAWCGEIRTEILVARSLIHLPRGNGIGGSVR